MMKNRDVSRRRRNARVEKPRLPRDPSTRRRAKVRQSLRDRLPRGRRSGRSIKATKSLRRRRVKAAKPEKAPRELARKNDIARSNDLRPVRGYEPTSFENVSYRDEGFSRAKNPDRSDIYFLDYMHDVNEKYRTMVHDELLLKKESRSERRELRYHEEIPPKRSVREKSDRYSRPESPSRKYDDLAKYERRLRADLSMYKKNDNYDSFSKYPESFPSNSRIERYDKYAHENHSSRRSVYEEKPRKHDEFSKNHAPPPKHRDRISDRLSPLLDRNFIKELSPPRRLTSEKYDRRKDWPISRLPSLTDKFSRHDVPSPKRYDKHNSDPYPRRKDIPEERPPRNTSPSRRKYDNPPPSRKYDNPPPSRSFPDRHEKYSHNNLSPRRNDKYDLPPPPPPPRREPERDRHRRPRDSPHTKPERRDRPSPRRRAEKREKYSSDFPPPPPEKRDRYYEHGEPRSEKPPPLLPPRKSAHDRLDDAKKYPPRLDRRDKHLTEMAHSGKLQDPRNHKTRPSRPERPPEQYARRDAKPVRNAAPPPNSKRKRSGDSKRARKRRPRTPVRERRTKYPENADTRIITFRKSRPKPDKQPFDERWLPVRRSV